MELDPRIALIASIGEEIIGLDNLPRLLANKPVPIAYDGFEPSGRMHIAQGLLRAHNVNKFVKSGVKFKFWVADWFALMNLKLGGDLNRIQKAGQLMIETWKACGMDLDSKDPEGNPMVEFVWSSHEIIARSSEYWRLVLDIATKFNLNRIKKCTQIMGRKEESELVDGLVDLLQDITQLETQCEAQASNQFEEIIQRLKTKLTKMIESHKTELATSQIFYPVMQCADIFFLGADICSLGLDQKKVNMLAIEYCDKIKRKNKPIIVSHHMIMGLDGSDKMSKSNPDNTIFMDDSESEVKRKITKAFCEPGNIKCNPLLDWAKWLILPLTWSIDIPGNPKFGEPDKTFSDFDTLEAEFAAQKIFPTELKKGMIAVINKLLNPVRAHFEVNKEANVLLKQVLAFKAGKD